MLSKSLRNAAVLAAWFLSVCSGRAWVQSNSGTWPDGLIPMVLMLGSSPALSDGGTWTTNATWAMDQWNRNMGRSQFSSTTSASTSGVDGNHINEIFFSATTGDEAWGTNTLAVTLSWYAGTRRTQSDILFNSTLTWDAYRGALRFSGGRSVPEFRRVALHELGHVIGLGHPDSAGQSVSAVMNATISSIETLMTDDKDGAGGLYGPGLDNPVIPPTIQTQPKSVTVSEEYPATLRVSATGTAPLGFQWHKDNVAIPGATKADFAIDSAEFSDAGTYHVLVSNAAASVVSNSVIVSVTPLPKPSFNSPLWGATWTHGESGVLSPSVAGGAGRIRYQWRRDGVDLPGANNQILRLEPAKLWDTGVYELVMTNRAGSAVSTPAVVTVQGPLPLRYSSEPNAITVRLGDYLSIGMGVFGGGDGSGVWKKNGTVIPGADFASFTKSVASAADAGRYEFVYTSPRGTIASRPVLVSVLPPAAPVIRSVPSGGTYEFGSYIGIAVEGDGQPSPKYSWTKDGVAKVDWTGGFSISSATEADAGLYTLTLSNEAGSTSKSLRITIVPRSEERFFVSSPTPLHARDGDWVSLGFQLNDATGATYQWFKDGAILPGATFAMLTFQPLSPGSIGTYFVEAKVGATTLRSGEAPVRFRSTTALDFLNQPGAVTFWDGSNETLSCNLTWPSGTGFPAAQWYRDGAPVVGATSPNLSRTWTSDMAGVYTLQVTLGATTVTSVPIPVVVRPRPLPVIQVPPADKILAIGADFSLHVVSQNGTSFQWKKNGVPLGLPSALPDYYGGRVTSSAAGSYSVVVGNSTGTVESPACVVTVEPGIAPIVLRSPDHLWASSSNYPRLEVRATGSPPLTYRWKKDGALITGATGEYLNLDPISANVAGNYTVLVSNEFGTTESVASVVSFDGIYGTPIVIQPPSDTTGVVGQTAALYVVGWGEPHPSIQWRRNGVPIPGATKWKLDISNAQLSDSASYDAVVSNSRGSVTTQSANLTIGVDNGRIVALSARAQVGTGGDVLIPGFLIGGSTPKKLLLRALGPTLTGYGVQGALADPKLVLKALGSDTVIASNDDWSGSGADPTLPALFTQVGAAALTTGSKDAALVATLAPGLYTAITSGADGGKGVALLEVFDVDPAAGKLTGISTRAIVGTGSNVLIPGIVVDGPVAKKLLIRVSGPALAQYGVTGTLADPKIELKSANGTTLQLNDNWDKTDTALTGAVAQIGLGAFADGSKDAAILATLTAGLYTIVISGADGGSGVALVEVYDVP